MESLTLTTLFSVTMRHPRKNARMEAMEPEVFSADKLPDPWLIESEFLLKELARIRSLALLVPTSTKTIELAMPINSVIDALWRLEEQLRFLLLLHRQGQQSFARKAQQPNEVRKGAAVATANLSAPARRVASKASGKVVRLTDSNAA
jgi:hypothetical protein